MKKIIATILALTLSAACLFGCSPSNGAGSSNELTVWTVAPIVYNYKDILKVSPNDKQAKFTQEIIGKFEEENNCDIKLQNRGFGDALNEALMPALNAGTAGDIVPGEMYLNAYYKSGFYEEINLDQELLDDFIPQVNNRMRYNDKVYGVPIQTGVMALNINKQALRAAGAIDENDEPKGEYANKGLNPLAPKTWEELLEICEMIRQDYVTNGTPDKGAMLLPKTVSGSAWRLLPVMRTAGGEIYKDGKITMNSAENRKAFDLIRELSATVPDGSFNAQNDDALHEYFWNSKGCYIIEGTDILARRYRYEAKFKNVYDDVIAVELPVFEGETPIKSNVLVGTLYFSITKKCKNKELAMKFINFLLSDYVQQKLVESDYRVPIRKSILNQEQQKTDGNAQYMDAFFAPVTDPDYKFDGGLPDFERNAGNIWDDWNYFVSKLLGSKEDLTTLINKAQSDMQGELDKVS